MKLEFHLFDFYDILDQLGKWVKQTKLLLKQQ